MCARDPKIALNFQQPPPPCHPPPTTQPTALSSVHFYDRSLKFLSLFIFASVVVVFQLKRVLHLSSLFVLYLWRLIWDWLLLALCQRVH